MDVDTTVSLLGGTDYLDKISDSFVRIWVPAVAWRARSVFDSFGGIGIPVTHDLEHVKDWVDRRRNGWHLTFEGIVSPSLTGHI